MAEKVLELRLKRDHKKFLYFIDGEGSVCRTAKVVGCPSGSEVLKLKAVKREQAYLYFIDKDGDVARSPRGSWRAKGNGRNRK